MKMQACHEQVRKFFATGREKNICIPTLQNSRSDHGWIQGQDNIPLEALQKLTDASVGTLLFTGKENENDREQGVRHTAESRRRPVR